MRGTDQSTLLQEETSFHMTKLNSNATKGETPVKISDPRR